MLWLNAMSYLALACQATKRTDISASLYSLLIPYSGMMASNGTIDAGPVDLHLGILAAVEGKTATAQAHLNAAITQCQRIDAPLWHNKAKEVLRQVLTLT